MDTYELEELHEKITYHFSEVENNLDILSELLDELDVEDRDLLEFKEVLRTVFSNDEDKYEQTKNEHIKEEE